MLFIHEILVQIGVLLITLQVYQQSVVHVTDTSWDIPHYVAGDCALQSSGDPQPVHGATS